MQRPLRLLLFLLLIPSFASAAGSRVPSSSKAPSFVLPTRDGVVASDSLHAKVVLVDFWASWCGPCRQSFPWLEAMHQKYGAKGLQVVAIDLDKTRDPAAAFLAKYPASFTVAFDPDGKTAEAFKVRGMPSGFLLAADGSILHASTGFTPKKAAEVESLIQRACTP